MEDGRCRLPWKWPVENNDLIDLPVQLRRRKSLLILGLSCCSGSSPITTWIFGAIGGSPHGARKVRGLIRFGGFQPHPVGLNVPYGSLARGQRRLALRQRLP